MVSDGVETILTRLLSLSRDEAKKLDQTGSFARIWDIGQKNSAEALQELKTYPISVLTTLGVRLQNKKK